MSLVVLFPVGKEAYADAYLGFCNANNPDNSPNTVWYLATAIDKYGQRVVAYMGPGGFVWNGEPFPEPDGGAEARSEGVLSNAVEWPVPEGGV